MSGARRLASPAPRRPDRGRATGIKTCTGEGIGASKASSADRSMCRWRRRCHAATVPIPEHRWLHVTDQRAASRPGTHRATSSHVEDQRPRGRGLRLATATSCRRALRASTAPTVISRPPSLPPSAIAPQRRLGLAGGRHAWLDLRCCPAPASVSRTECAALLENAVLSRRGSLSPAADTATSARPPRQNVAAPAENDRSSRRRSVERLSAERPMLALCEVSRPDRKLSDHSRRAASGRLRRRERRGSSHLRRATRPFLTGRAGRSARAGQSELWPFSSRILLSRNKHEQWHESVAI